MLEEVHDLVEGRHQLLRNSSDRWCPSARSAGGVKSDIICVSRDSRKLDSKISSKLEIYKFQHWLSISNEEIKKIEHVHFLYIKCLCTQHIYIHVFHHVHIQQEKKSNNT